MHLFLLLTHASCELMQTTSWQIRFTFMMEIILTGRAVHRGVFTLSFCTFCLLSFYQLTARLTSYGGRRAESELENVKWHP